MSNTVSEIPVTCPVCKGRALLSKSDRVVECFNGGHISHKLIFLKWRDFEDLLKHGHIPPR